MYQQVEQNTTTKESMKIYQNLLKSGAKKGQPYYTCKAAQSGTLYVQEGKYSVKVDKEGKPFGILSLQLNPPVTSSYDITRFEDGKVQDLIPYELPILVNMKIDIGGTASEQAIHKIFTSDTIEIASKKVSAKGIELAKGFAGEISWGDTPQANRIATGENVREYDYNVFADIVVAVASSIKDEDIPSGNSGGYTAAKGESDIDKRSSRLDYLDKATTPETPEALQLAKIATALEIDRYIVLTMLMS